MFRIFFFIVAVVLVCAKEWTHYTKQNEIRDVVLMENGTLWAAFAWGLQERLTNKTVNTYMPGNNNLKAADFFQLFALPGDDIIAASKSGILVRKNKNSKNFEIINNSFAEKKRNLLQGLGKRAENILILPFEGAIAFFDYEQSRSVITLTQIGSSSLEEYEIKRVAVKNDSIWIDLGAFVWKRRMDWKEIHRDNFLADQNSWIEARDKKIPFDEEAKPPYTPSVSSDFPLQRARAISLHENNMIIWGIDDDADYFVRVRNDEWGWRFPANTSPFYDNQKDATSNSLALLPDGNFAMGRWGAGLLVFNNGFPEAQFTHWFHSRNTGNTCPTEWSNLADEGWTIVQGLVPAPDYSGYIFSYVSESKYGLGFVNNSGYSICVKPAEASSPVAFAIITRQREAGNWEIYATWKYSMDSKGGGVDFYLTPQNKFSPALQQKWTLPFDSPTDFAFDSKGVLWAVSESKIFYLSQKDDEWKEPSYIRGFGGGMISDLNTDAQNGLWVSTLGDGAYSFSQINNSPDSLIAKQYKIKDGLLNEIVYGIAIDTVKGKVYFAHDLGLSVYSTALVRSASGYMQGGSPKPVAYPNPFRPNVHSSVTINFISEKSSVYILDSSGKRVRLFRGKDLRGGAVVWDGKNESGKFVAPGLYYYIAADGKNTAKGKIIIER
ncbi:MAG: hypothetical protein LBQ76_02630 [Candidatus Fibromonas sp.]|jgi:hypothetical protein|nr:hypothetical protein [Candidatus Fibromonas sp.]